MEVFTSALCVILTLLFLKLCWFEPRWRKDILRVNNIEHSPYFGFVQLYIHCVELPLGLASLLLVKDRAMLQAVMPAASFLTLASFTYGMGYLGLLVYMYAVRGIAIYPFLCALPVPLGWIGFGGVVSVFVALTVNILAWLT